jgi:hypothetical protein
MALTRIIFAAIDNVARPKGFFDGRTYQDVRAIAVEIPGEVRAA